MNSISQQVIPLYGGAIPGGLAVANQEKSDTSADGIIRISLVSEPDITVFLPTREKATGSAVIICPGGGYRILAIGHEGYDVARKFAANGIAGIVLKYRLPDSSIMKNPSTGPLQDVQSAFKLVARQSGNWGIDPAKTGIMGFSAGGHLAANAGTKHQTSLVENPEQFQLRPAFMLLIYPVISLMPGIGHKGSADRLLGRNASTDSLQAYSNEYLVNTRTPPTFLVHASDDKTVISKNSLLFYEALLKNNIPAELHIYTRGGHGFGLNIPHSSTQWFDRALSWMSEMGFR